MYRNRKHVRHNSFMMTNKYRKIIIKIIFALSTVNMFYYVSKKEKKYCKEMRLNTNLKGLRLVRKKFEIFHKLRG